MFLTTFVIRLSSPDFQLYYILLTEIIYDEVGTSEVTCLGFAVVIAYAVDNRAKVCEENLSAVVLNKLTLLYRLYPRWAAPRQSSGLPGSAEACTIIGFAQDGLRLGIAQASLALPRLAPSFFFL